MIVTWFKSRSIVQAFHITQIMLGSYKRIPESPVWQQKELPSLRGRLSHLSRYLSRQSRTVLLIISVVCVLSAIADLLSQGHGYPLRHVAHGHDVQHSSEEIQSGSLKNEKSKIGKLSMLYGDPNPLYERALAGHKSHDERFGYRFSVLREKTLPSYWSKPAFILQHILAELAKPEGERLEWLVWFDADTVLMNPKIPLEIFLPPTDWEHIHAVVTNDHRGLNNGVFFIRVHEWSVWLMTACLGTEIFDPSMQLEFGDQSALFYWINQDRFRANTIHVPQRWFNAYAGFRGEPTESFADPLQPQHKFRPNSIKEGDILVHHAGHKSLRAQRMSPWLDVAEQHLPSWELELEQTTYPKEIEQFWLNDAVNERKTVDRMNQQLAAIKKQKEAKAAKASAQNAAKQAARATAMRFVRP